MRRKIVFLLLTGFILAGVYAQSDDDLFSDEDLFGEDEIEEITDVSAKSDLSKGIIFDNGTVKVGGSLTAGISTTTIFYSPLSTDFGENLKNTTLTPELSALLSVDARPSETLRIYTKFGFDYPFNSKINGYVLKNTADEIVGFDENYMPVFGKKVDASFSDWLKLKELFTDFSIKDRAFFRFGIHTVTWGAGYFFSPVSDMINTSSIDPEHPEKQVDGALNLRTQIIFPNSQNCLWFYVIPSTDFANQTAESYARDTAFAGKADILIDNWELGIGGFFKYQNAPKVMLTATGSIKKINLFGEFVYSYGAAQEWAVDQSWGDKTNIIQATAGLSYSWDEPKISLTAQYYYNGNTKDFPYNYLISGHNLAAAVSFGKIFGNTDFTASIFSIANIGRKEFEDSEIALLKLNGADDSTISAITGTSFTTTAMIYYSPLKELKMGLGPVISFKTFEENPTIAFKLSASLGGGNF